MNDLSECHLACGVAAAQVGSKEEKLWLEIRSVSPALFTLAKQAKKCTVAALAFHEIGFLPPPPSAPSSDM